MNFLDKNYRDNKIPKSVDGDNYSNNDQGQLKGDNDNLESGDKNTNISIDKDTYDKLNPDVRTTVNEITEILNKKLKDIHVSDEHKSSLQEQIQ